MNNNIKYVILLIFNILIYGFCCLMILNRKKYTCISIRTPTLLLTNNLAGFFFIYNNNNK